MPPDSQPPHLLERLDEVLPVVRRPRFGLVMDFDGTLSVFAPTPDEAVIYPPSRDELQRLVPKIALVAVVSGRQVKNLRDKVGLDGVIYAGNHGAEYIVGGQHTTAPGAAEYRERIMAVFDHIKASTSDPGMVWDDKLLSATVHFRLSENREGARRQLEAALRSAPGIGELEIFWGNLVLEIRAHIGLNKGYAVHKLARDYDLDSVMFLGDDTTDVDAMLAVRELSRQGAVSGIGVAVIHEASPRPLIEAADYRLESVAEVAEFLGWLGSVVG